MKTLLILALAISLQGCANIDRASKTNAQNRARGEPTLSERLDRIATRAAAGADGYYSTRAAQPLPRYEPLPCAACAQEEAWHRAQERNRALHPIEVRIVK